MYFSTKYTNILSTNIKTSLPMLVDTISKVKNVTFDATNLDAYVTSLRGLSATQAKVVLSSTSLDKVQQKQILNKHAEKCNISRTYMQKIETAASSCTLDTLIDIADALDIELKKLFEFRD